MKKVLKPFFRGAVAGVAVQYIAAIALSYALHLGYFMPYPAVLSETLGGELNAVLLTALISAALGGLIALGLRHFRHAALCGRPAAQYR